MAKRQLKVKETRKRRGRKWRGLGTERRYIYSIYIYTHTHGMEVTDGEKEEE